MEKVINVMKRLQLLMMQNRTQSGLWSNFERLKRHGFRKIDTSTFRRSQLWFILGSSIPNFLITHNR
jgi:hypothetical protein